MLSICLQPVNLHILLLLFSLIFLDILLLLNQAYAYSARPFVGFFHLELDLLILIQRVEGRFDKRGLMEEHLAAVRIGNEPEPPVTHQFFYSTFMHL